MQSKTFLKAAARELPRQQKKQQPPYQKKKPKLKTGRVIFNAEMQRCLDKWAVKGNPMYDLDRLIGRKRGFVSNLLGKFNDGVKVTIDAGLWEKIIAVIKEDV